MPKYPDGFIIHMFIDDILGTHLLKNSRYSFTNLCIDRFIMRRLIDDMFGTNLFRNGIRLFTNIVQFTSQQR